MNETITLPVDYLGEVQELALKIVRLGYTYQLHILVEGKTLIFEKDDQGKAKCGLQHREDWFGWIGVSKKSSRYLPTQDYPRLTILQGYTTTLPATYGLD